MTPDMSHSAGYRDRLNGIPPQTSSYLHRDAYLQGYREAESNPHCRNARNEAYLEMVRTYVGEGFNSPDDLCLADQRELASAYLNTKTVLEVDDLMTGIAGAAYATFLANADDTEAALLFAHQIYRCCEGDIRRDFELVAQS